MLPSGAFRPHLAYNTHMTKTLIHGNGFFASPNMVTFAQRMVEQEINQARINQEIRQGLRPAPRSFGYSQTWNISDRD